MENLNFITKTRHKKTPHSLHECEQIEDLEIKLGKMGINLTQLVFEFLKPKSNPGIIVTGSIANRIGTHVSDLDIVVLLSTLSSVKKGKCQIFGHSVNFLPHADENKMEASFFLKGIEFDIFFLANYEIAHIVESGNLDILPTDVSFDDHHQMVFMGRLQNSWVVRNENLVNHWKKYYQIENYRINRIVSVFTRANKNLEDMHATIGLGVGCVGVLGISIVGSGLKALLAFNGFCFLSSKWMRKINHYIENGNSDTSTLMSLGRDLMFPGLLESIEDEINYFNQVYLFIKRVQSELSSEKAIEQILENIGNQLDLIL